MQVKKVRGGNHNPTGKGGFQERPHDRNANGQRSSEVVAFNTTLRALIVNYGQQNSTKKKTLKRVESMIDTLWDLAEDGEAWAVQFIAERVEGKVKDELLLNGAQKLLVEYVDRATNKTA